MEATKDEKLRLDKYLWAIRIFKTRSLAVTACEKGKVKMNGEALKAARTVKRGDIYEIKTEARKWIIIVNELLYNRVAFAESLKYYTDQTPDEIKQIDKQVTASFFTGKRLSKTGKPTKKQRRDFTEYFEE